MRPTRPIRSPNRVVSTQPKKVYRRHDTALSAHLLPHRDAGRRRRRRPARHGAGRRRRRLHGGPVPLPPAADPFLPVEEPRAEEATAGAAGAGAREAREGGGAMAGAAAAGSGAEAAGGGRADDGRARGGHTGDQRGFQAAEADGVRPRGRWRRGRRAGGNRDPPLPCGAWGGACCIGGAAAAVGGGGGGGEEAGGGDGGGVEGEAKHAVEEPEGGVGLPEGWSRARAAGESGGCAATAGGGGEGWRGGRGGDHWRGNCSLLLPILTNFFYLLLKFNHSVPELRFVETFQTNMAHIIVILVRKLEPGWRFRRLLRDAICQLNCQLILALKHRNYRRHDLLDEMWNMIYGIDHYTDLIILSFNMGQSQAHNFNTSSYYLLPRALLRALGISK